MPIPPGTILQQMYLHGRLSRIPPGRFIEIGAGTGGLARMLIKHGWHGTAYELNPATAAIARDRNPALTVHSLDWLKAPPDQPADLVISSMVIEHLADDDEAMYFRRAKAALRPGGRAIILTPGSPAHWGIEDVIAGHYRRYTRGGLTKRLQELGWTVEHLAGLTYPLSNLLLPISNRLVSRHEGDLLALGDRERTMRSGDRAVPGKTTFPRAGTLLLNPVAMYPWHLLQRAFSASQNALVLYAEARPA